MLIKLVGHYHQNPSHIDKLICINGLPDEWIFKPSPDGGKELIRPWQADHDVNIPESIRQFCDPQEITFRYSPIEKGRDWVVEKKIVLGLKLDYMTEPGRELWDRIEHYLEGTVPRDIQIPKPVLCAKDQKSPFEIYAIKRRISGGMELQQSQVPVIDLKPKVALIQTPVAQEVKEVLFKCEDCKREFSLERILRAHQTRSHKKEKVAI